MKDEDEVRRDETYETAEGESPETRDEVVIPLMEEELEAGTHEVKTGAVRVEKRVEQRVRRVQMPLVQEDVEVRRVAINRVVAEAPKVRRKGETIIVPVVEEQMVVTKRLVLKEEIHLVKRRSRNRVVKDVTLDKERAEVRRVDAEGRDVPVRRRAGG